ncbi:hypothetical protein VTK73DRAFT_2890 [Phialemonium thermophilum]|uniref:FAD dependent oxidoreductase domain-containing protein n=1 Tax=Phialemonium thermophilum TaxID=223376 RepID=A0ABR3X2E0_9PEZI
MSKSQSILIIGGGAFGTSTAYHLALRGYTHVRVLDRYDTPSHDAASTDLNKIVRADYPDPMYLKMGVEAMEIWKSPTSFLQGLFHQTGWLMAAHELTIGWLQKAYATAKSLGHGDTRWLSSEDVKRQWPVITGPMEGWKNVWNSEAGWVPSSQALVRMAREAQAEGVVYITGDDGYVTKLLYDDKNTCVGALTASGRAHFADTVIVSNGSAIPTLVDAKDESIGTAGCLVVIKLTPAEIERYKRMPIIDDMEHGIAFPPDDHGLMKIICNHSITNYAYSTVPGASITHSHGDHPYDGIPREIEADIRKFLRDILPELAERPWVTTRMCWDCHTKDLHFRICPYPKARNLYIATCGAHHGFKFMPIIGRYVVDMLEGKLSEQHARAWSWKSGRGPEAELLDPHPYQYRDLGELTGWKDRNRDLAPPSRALRALL